MKKKLFSLLLVFGTLLASTSTAVLADEVPAGDTTSMTGSTNVDISVVTTPIILGKVVAPTFGTYATSTKEQTIKATGDLSIEVLDSRMEDQKSSPWNLSYQLSTFVNGKEYTVHLAMGKGTVKDSAGNVMKGENFDIQADSGESKNITTSYSDTDVKYYYVVPKDRIKLTLPADMPVGTYKAQQTVVLTSTPDAE